MTRTYLVYFIYSCICMYDDVGYTVVSTRSSSCQQKLSLPSMYMSSVEGAYTPFELPYLEPVVLLWCWDPYLPKVPPYRRSESFKNLSSYLLSDVLNLASFRPYLDAEEYFDPMYLSIVAYFCVVA